MNAINMRGLKKQKSNAAKKVRQRDPMQNAREINICETVRHAAHVENSEKKKNQGTDENSPNRTGLSLLRDNFLDGKWNGHANEENEQGKNQVVKMKPGPFAMLHLVGEPASGG